MKKRLLVLSVLTLSALAIASCGKKNNNTENTTEVATEATTEASSTATEATEANASTEATTAVVPEANSDIPAIVTATASDATLKMELYYNDGTRIAGRTDYIYDKDLLQEKLAYCRDGVTPYRHVVYTYDEKGNCITEKAFNEEKKDVLEYDYENEYNDAGLLVKQVNKASSTATTNIYEYDSNNNLIKMTTSDTVTPCISYITYTYTADGLIETESTYDANDVLSLTNEYIYEDGLLTRLNVRSGDTIYGYRTYEYNDKKLRTKETVYFNDTVDHEEVFEYDSFGNVIKQDTVYGENDFSSTFFSY